MTPRDRTSRLMKLPRCLAFLICLLLGSSGRGGAQIVFQREASAPGGLTTLYQLDPVSQSFSFTENYAGSVMKDHRVLNGGAEIDFGRYRPGCFSVAVSVGSTGRIVDLGDARTLRAKYHYRETVGDGQGFASIHRKGPSFLIGQRDDKEDHSEYQGLTEGAQLSKDLRSLDSAPVTLGHIYLLHVVQDRGQPTDIYVKLIVVGHQPDQSVTFRWEIMRAE